MKKKKEHWTKSERDAKTNPLTSVYCDSVRCIGSHVICGWARIFLFDFFFFFGTIIYHCFLSLLLASIASSTPTMNTRFSIRQASHRLSGNVSYLFKVYSKLNETKWKATKKMKQTKMEKFRVQNVWYAYGVRRNVNQNSFLKWLRVTRCLCCRPIRHFFLRFISVRCLCCCYFVEVKFAFYSRACAVEIIAAYIVQVHAIKSCIHHILSVFLLLFQFI